VIRPAILKWENCFAEAAADESGYLERKRWFFVPKTRQKWLKSGLKVRVMFIDQLTGDLSKLFIPEYLENAWAEKIMF
jgi:hypothetical protein